MLIRRSTPFLTLANVRNGSKARVRGPLRLSKLISSSRGLLAMHPATEPGRKLSGYGAVSYVVRSPNIVGQGRLLDASGEYQQGFCGVGSVDC